MATPVMDRASTVKAQMLLLVWLISWTFMPKMEDARLVGTKMKARMVTRLRRLWLAAAALFFLFAGFFVGSFTQFDTFSFLD